MQESIEEIKNRNKNKRNNLKFEQKTNESDKPSYLSRLFTRVLLAIIFVLISVIYVKYSDENLLLYKDQILNQNISFGKINSLYKKYFGAILPLENIINDPTQSVFNEKLNYTNIEEYHEGSKLKVGEFYAIPVIESGLVVFSGEKENYGKTIIIQGVDGVDIWYGNIKNQNVKLYDYVEKGSLLGEVEGETLYLVLQKGKEYIMYENYKK